MRCCIMHVFLSCDLSALARMLRSRQDVRNIAFMLVLRNYRDYITHSCSWLGLANVNKYHFQANLQHTVDQSVHHP